MTSRFWSVPSERLLHELETDVNRGLLSTEARRRLYRHGPNELTGKEGPSAFEIYFRQFKSPLLYILLFAAAFSAWEREWSEVVVILSVVVLNSLIGFFQERKAEQTMSKLRQILSPKARVLRSGIEQKIDAAEVVVGDLLLVEAGDRVAADARIIESQGLRVNQASLTGESVPAHKKPGVVAADAALIDRKNMLYMSTLVVTGQAVAVVTGTGMKTEIGSIAKEVSEVKELPENLQRQLTILGRSLLGVAAVAAIISYTIGAMSGISASDMLKVAITLMVSIIPEGLPIAITVTLSIGLLRVYRRGAIIRKLSATETLGSTTVICVDKTGTLTEGKMMVERLYVGLQDYEVTGEGYQLSGSFRLDKKTVDPHKQKALNELLELSSLATMSTITEKDLRDDQARELTDPTETALAVLAAKAGYYAFAQEKKYPEVLEVPFNQDLRYSTSVHDYGKFHRYIVKGAPEKILSLSQSFLSQAGASKRLLSSTKSALEDYAHELARSGYRIIALAYVDYPKSVPVEEKQVKNITFVGYIAMTDPIRHEAAPSIQKAIAAGMKVVMITGDHLLTATSIGQKLGLLDEKRKAIHADEFLHHDRDQIGVIARSTPTQKLQIVERFQKNGDVVAMTGDGVNDAPALKKADIGIAMGRAGTDVAIETSDMVLLKDNFNSIVDAIEQGRLIWENTKKVVFLLVSTSIADATLVVSALLLGLPLPLLPVQILWLNLVTDGVNSMALTVEPEERDLMRMRPRKMSDKLITRATLGRMLLLSLVMAVVTISLYRYSLTFGEAYARTMALTTMVFFQLFNVFNSRSATQSITQIPFFTNRLILITVPISIILQLAALRIPFLQQMLGTVALDTSGIIVAFMAASSILFADELRKWVLWLLRRWAISQIESKEEYTSVK